MRMTSTSTGQNLQDSESSSTKTGAADYSQWSHAHLISRVGELERELQAKNAEYHHQCNSDNQSMSVAGPSTTGITTLPAQIPSSLPTAKQSTRTFDITKYSTRHIALKFAYLGQAYNGYECANGNTTPLPTVEEVLWKALRKGRLISPPVSPKEMSSVEVLWDEQERMKTPVFLNWEGCQYSKCGRTDRGVSAFGQVIGIRVRSNRPVRKMRDEGRGKAVEGESGRAGLLGYESGGFEGLSSLGMDSDSESDGDDASSFDPIADELPYLSILNNILPRDIRALAWCPNPPPDFDARFSCGQRRYKYFFTNPAFLPTPGPTGLRDTDGNDLPLRTGYLDIDRMREACAHFVGLHDFRNFCRIDESKQMASCQRRVLHADIEEVPGDGPQFLARTAQLARSPVAAMNDVIQRSSSGSDGPKVYCFTVHGTAFLWHQIRCMVAVLFLIGQHLEKPSLIQELLDIEANPCRPTYTMASDAPLVLWDCLFPDKESGSEEDALDWIYAGDATSVEGLNTKSDGKFGIAGTVDEIWKVWRKRKIDEVLAARLMDLVAGQGDGSSLERGGHRFTDPRPRSQKVFDGGNVPRFAGKYVPVMQQPKMDTLEVQNAKWREGKGARRIANKRTTETPED